MNTEQRIDPQGNNIAMEAPGVAITCRTRQVEMGALDALPTEVRKWVYDAKIPISPVSLQGILEEHGVAGVYLAIKSTEERVLHPEKCNGQNKS